MKNLFISFFTLGASLVLNAQDKLMVNYESRMEVDADAMMKQFSANSTSNVDVKQFEKAILESMTRPTYYHLRIDQNESVFQQEERIQNEQPKEPGGVRVVMYGGGTGILYKNLQEQQSLRSQDAFSKSFLIQDELKKYDWKISKESKEILGYEVRKAEAKIDSTSSIVAWYAPKLPYKNGPAEYQGLPGLILELEESRLMDDSSEKTIFLATSIEVDKNQEPIKKPTKGQAVTQEEFQDFLKNRSEKMKEMHQGGVDRD